MEHQGFITNRSTKETAWARAEAKANQWEGWGATMAPAAEQHSGATVQYAVEAFLESKGPRNENVEPATFRKLDVLLNQRLVPYATLRGFRFIRSFEDLDEVTKFRESWVNLNPAHNKKMEAAMQAKPLSASTARAELERMRQFFRFCVKRHWMRQNPAEELTVKVKVEEKEPFAADEMQRIYESTKRIQDGHGRVDQQNARELLAFIYVLRYSGLRISDVTTLEKTQLVSRPSDPTKYALSVYQQKVQRTVYIPIPSGEYGHPNIVAALQDLPVRQDRFFFWTGVGTRQTATNNWRARVDSVLKLSGPFRHKPHPHRFRHTFAAEHLMAGMDIRDVSLMLGHRSVTVTEKHYAKFTEATRRKLDASADESFKKQMHQSTLQVGQGQGGNRDGLAAAQSRSG